MSLAFDLIQRSLMMVASDATMDAYWTSHNVIRIHQTSLSARFLAILPVQSNSRSVHSAQETRSQPGFLLNLASPLPLVERDQCSSYGVSG